MSNVERHMILSITPVVSVIFILTGCVQPGILVPSAESLPPTSSEPPIKASPAQTETELPTKVYLPPLQITATPYQAGQILDLAYADRLWALVSVYEFQVDHNSFIDLVLESSSDGGITWEIHSIPAARPTTQSDLPMASQVAFMDQNTGWVFDPGLFETQDGGRSWKQIPTDEKVKAILPAERAGGQNWALGGTCAAEGQDCTYHLLNLDSQSDNITALSGYPPLHAGQSPVLYRLGEHTAFVFAHDISTEATPSDLMALWFADGNGSKWKKLDTPCLQYGLFSISPEGWFWLECGIIFSGADEAKGIYVSTDQGANWELRSASNGLNEETPPTTHPLKIFGNVTDLLPLSRDEVLVGLSHDALYLSVDGSRDWGRVIPPLGPDSPIDISGWKLVSRPGSDEIWAVANTQPLSSWLYFSRDRGRSWSKVKTSWP